MFSISRDAAPSPSHGARVTGRGSRLAAAAGRPAPRGRRRRDDPVLAACQRPAGRPPARRSRTPTGLAPLDALLDGGVPHGPARGAGRPADLRAHPGASRARSRAPRARGGWAALVDGTDGLDPAAAAMVGVPLGRLLWVRCGGRLPRRGAPRTSSSRGAGSSWSWSIWGICRPGHSPALRPPSSCVCSGRSSARGPGSSSSAPGAWPEASPRSRWRSSRGSFTGRPAARACSRGSRPRPG